MSQERSGMNVPKDVAHLRLENPVMKVLISHWSCFFQQLLYARRVLNHQDSVTIL